MQKPTNEKELLDYPSDTFDNEYPLFRNPNATDSGKTVATGKFIYFVINTRIRLKPIVILCVSVKVLFNIRSQTMTVFFGKPNGEYELRMQIRIWKTFIEQKVYLISFRI